MFTHRLACKELVKCHQARSLNGSWQNPGPVLSILQHHLLVPYLASNYLFACGPWPAAICSFFQESHWPHCIQGHCITTNSLSHMTDTPQWHFWDLPNSVPCWDTYSLDLNKLMWYQGPGLRLFQLNKWDDVFPWPRRSWPYMQCWPINILASADHRVLSDKRYLSSSSRLYHLLGFSHI